MGPKKGKKGGAGGGGGQGEEAVAGEKMNEVDKEWFGIQIKSLEEKLDRRNEKLRSVSVRDAKLFKFLSGCIAGGSRRETPSWRPSIST